MTEGGAQAPFRINFIALGSAADVDLIARARNCPAPYVKPRTVGRLAVVGLGPSLFSWIEELREWDGDIWAINGAASWLAKHNIDSTMITVDPKVLDVSDFEGVSSAIFASCAHPQAFETMRGKVEKFDMSDHIEGGIIGGCSTASRMPALAISIGYTEVTFYGCEGSFAERNYVNSARNFQPQLVIRADGRDYRTVPEFVLQSQSLAEIISEWPDIFKEKSGGLLRGMIRDPQWSVVAVSGELKEQIEMVSGRQGLYETTYMEQS